MMIKRQREKGNIHTRVLYMMIFPIFFVFITIAVVFNIFMNGFIHNSVSEQLDVTYKQLSAITSEDSEYIPAEEWVRFSIYKMSQDKFGTQVKIFLMDANYNVTEISTNDKNDVETAKAIASVIKEHNGSQQKEIQIKPISTANEKFYITSFKIRQELDNSEKYAVIYADVTGISRFAGSINILLFTLMGAAITITAIASVFMSWSITKPIRDLTLFAKRIGKGDYTLNTTNYKDEEMTELCINMNNMARQIDIFDKDQKMFFQNVSHELRTPLMSIRCYAEGVECGLMDPKKSSRIIISETDRLSELVEDILYVSRMDSITESFVKTECDMRELLSTCAERQKVIAENKGIEFVYRFDEKPVLYECSEKHMTRAFSNLISNAVRYAKTEIILTCKIVGGHVLISVVDDGPGINESDIEHIYERFYKGETGKYGIGLAIVKSVIEQHKGVVTAENRQDGKNNSETGAKFIISL